MVLLVSQLVSRQPVAATRKEHFRVLAPERGIRDAGVPAGGGLVSQPSTPVLFHRIQDAITAKGAAWVQAEPSNS